MVVPRRPVAGLGRRSLVVVERQPPSGVRCLVLVFGLWSWSFGFGLWSFNAEFMRASGVRAVSEAHVPVAALRDGRVREVIVTASTSFVVAITSVDGHPVGDGTVGPVARALRDAWRRWFEEGVA